VHGFRSSFSDWVIDETSYGANLADMCIAHLTRGEVRAAYQRSPQLEKRRLIMTEWSDFVLARRHHVTTLAPDAPSSGAVRPIAHPHIG
jgi:hypothetical protein